MYNVSVTTVMTVEANSEDDTRLGAERYLRTLKGVDVMTDMTDSFESEPLSHDADLIVRKSGGTAAPLGR